MTALSLEPGRRPEIVAPLPQVCEDAPAELEVKLGGSLQRASDILIPKLLGLFTSPHDGIRAMVSTLVCSDRVDPRGRRASCGNAYTCGIPMQHTRRNLRAVDILIAGYCIGIG